MPITRINYTIDPDNLTSHDEFVLQTCENLIVTAVEGGIGYWAGVEGYRAECDERGGTPPITCTVYEHNESKLPANWTSGTRVNALLILNAVVSIVNNDHGLLHTGYNETLNERLLMLLSNETEQYDDFDADDADIIMQVAVLGDVVYG